MAVRRGSMAAALALAAGSVVAAALETELAARLRLADADGQMNAALLARGGREAEASARTLDRSAQTKCWFSCSSSSPEPEGSEKEEAKTTTVKNADKDKKPEEQQKQTTETKPGTEGKPEEKAKEQVTPPTPKKPLPEGFGEDGLPLEPPLQYKDKQPPVLVSAEPEVCLDAKKKGSTSVFASLTTDEKDTEKKEWSKLKKECETHEDERKMLQKIRLDARDAQEKLTAKLTEYDQYKVEIEKTYAVIETAAASLETPPPPPPTSR